MPGWDPFLHEQVDDSEADDLDRRARTRALVDDLVQRTSHRRARENESHRERLTEMLRQHNANIDPPADPYTGLRVTDELRTIMGAAPYRAPPQKVIEHQPMENEEASYGDEESWPGLPAGNPDAGTDAASDEGRDSGPAGAGAAAA